MNILFVQLQFFYTNLFLILVIKILFGLDLYQEEFKVQDKVEEDVPPA